MEYEWGAIRGVVSLSKLRPSSPPAFNCSRKLRERLYVSEQTAAMDEQVTVDPT